MHEIVQSLPTSAKDERWAIADHCWQLLGVARITDSYQPTQSYSLQVPDFVDVQIRPTIGFLSTVNMPTENGLGYDQGQRVSDSENHP